jgi:predicted nucleic acid-binding protein
MCVIVDVNVAVDVLLRSGNEYDSLRDKLFSPRSAVRLDHGGQLSQELTANRDVSQVIVELERAGKARAYNDSDIAVQQQHIANMNIHSDDPHILALARVSGARVLCTRDTDLITDFTAPQVLAHPRGRIYSRASHDHILRQQCKAIQ